MSSPTTLIALSLHDALPICRLRDRCAEDLDDAGLSRAGRHVHRFDRRTDRCRAHRHVRSEEHTSELQSHHDIVCRLLLEKKKMKKHNATLYICMTISLLIMS